MQFGQSLPKISHEQTLLTYKPLRLLSCVVLTGSSDTVRTPQLRRVNSTNTAPLNRLISTTFDVFKSILRRRQVQNFLKTHASGLKPQKKRLSPHVSFLETFVW